MILVQGDTTTTWAASLAGFYNRIPIGHVEAGLRTNNKYSPFPEEINRILTTHIADLHFAPTKWAAKNLIKEGIPKSRIFVTGNTVIDALHIVHKQNFPLCERGMKGDFNTIMSCHPEHSEGSEILRPYSPQNDKEQDRHPEGVRRTTEGSQCKMVLITGHRRENFGQGFRNICKAIKILANKFPDHLFVYPVHLNPNVRKHVMKMLKGERNIILTDPVDYITFVRLMANCTLILTDSGGIQEEAPAFGKPVLVMRDTTERPEAIWAGTAKLVGTNPKAIINSVTKLLNNIKYYKSTIKKHNPFGDGNVAIKIISILKSEYK